MHFPCPASHCKLSALFWFGFFHALREGLNTKVLMLQSSLAASVPGTAFPFQSRHSEAQWQLQCGWKRVFGIYWVPSPCFGIAALASPAKQSKLDTFSIWSTQFSKLSWAHWTVNGFRTWIFQSCVPATVRKSKLGQSTGLSRSVPLPQEQPGGDKGTRNTENIGKKTCIL